MRPRVLFVSRERFRLPLDGAQKRKWDAVGGLVEVRVIAAAPGGWPTRDDHFHLVGPIRPQLLDGALYYALLPWRIARELRNFEPDAALVQGVHETVAFLLARRLAGSRTKVILDVQGDWRQATRLYGSRFRWLLNPLNDALAPIAVRRADAVRTVSTHTTGLVAGLGVMPAATFPSYVDADVFLAAAPAALPAAPRALFVGVLERIKGFDTLVEAWRRAAPLVPGAVLHIVGDGGMRDRAERLVHELPDQTVWSGRLASEEVSGAMDSSWLLALPSRSEGLPRVAIEAACRARAIVGGNSAGIPDVVQADVNGLLVDPDDPDDLAAALVRVLSDRVFAERLGAAAHATGEKWAITPGVYADRLLALVRSIVPG
jgi:glycosyltransferase involved in cell wall biosynthesis